VNSSSRSKQRSDVVFLVYSGFLGIFDKIWVM